MRVALPRLKKTVRHLAEELAGFDGVAEQCEYRLRHIEEALQENSVKLDDIGAVVARGGMLKPIPGGTYEVTDTMVADLRQAKYEEHASNLECHNG